MLGDISQTEVRKIAFPAVRLAYSKCSAVYTALALLNQSNINPEFLIEKINALQLPCHIKSFLATNIEDNEPNLLNRLHVILVDFKEHDLKAVMKYARLLLSGSMRDNAIYETVLYTYVSEINYLLVVC